MCEYTKSIIIKTTNKGKYLKRRWSRYAQLNETEKYLESICVFCNFAAVNLYLII